MYRYILRESCSQFDSLPLTSLTIRHVGAYVISVTGVVRDDATNEIIELRCAHDEGEFILYRYISCESFSQFDSLPLTSFLRRCAHDEASFGTTVYVNTPPGEGAGGASVAGGVQPGVVHWVSAEHSIEGEFFYVPLHFTRILLTI